METITNWCDICGGLTEWLAKEISNNGQEEHTCKACGSIRIYTPASVDLLETASLLRKLYSKGD